jgi:hypothetical protein
MAVVQAGCPRPSGVRPEHSGGAVTFHSLLRGDQILAGGQRALGGDDEAIGLGVTTRRSCFCCVLSRSLTISRWPSWSFTTSAASSEESTAFDVIWGDSYWAPDYDVRVPPQDRTRDFSDDMEVRDKLLARIGDEAQWCLFDPILSAYYGRRALNTHSPGDRSKQVVHFNRSLAQITREWRCAELYYLRGGTYIPNPHVLLQWTQANLVLALQSMRATICG